MNTPTLKATRHFRDHLYRLLCRREILFTDGPSELARKEGVDNRELRRRIEMERRLKEDLAELDLFELTMPADELIATLERLRAEAQRAPTERRHPLEPDESDKERRSYYFGAAYVCGLMLEDLGVEIEEEAG